MVVVASTAYFCTILPGVWIAQRTPYAYENMEEHVLRECETYQQLIPQG
jgi:hypothetical protein